MGLAPTELTSEYIGMSSVVHRALQRMVRLTPGFARFAWARAPNVVRQRLSPWVYPIAAGERSPGFVLKVPAGLSVLPSDVALAVPSEHRAATSAGDAPGASVAIATSGNRELLGFCLRALVRNTPTTPSPSLEIIVVDNGSTDGTRALLESFAAEESRLVVIRNEENLGFARATNQALRVARGAYAVLLNDDTVVGPGWLSRLVAHLEAEPRLGLVGPVTNQIGNAAKIAIDYSTFDEMEAFATARAVDFNGQRRALPTLALFCAVARRDVLERAGLLDERYEVGMFEDDDLCETLRRAGYSFAVADDAFVHHVGQATLSKLDDARYLATWNANRRRFEKKWRRRWRPPE
jgi:GT2 family glycosyltransferase